MVLFTSTTQCSRNNDDTESDNYFPKQSQVRPPNWLIGEWEDSEYTRPISFIFTRDNIIMKEPGMVLLDVKKSIKEVGSSDFYNQETNGNNYFKFSISAGTPLNFYAKFKRINNDKVLYSINGSPYDDMWFELVRKK
ncbi:hypothetical protein [Riemerella columbina]|uniref:hypothetical protein n=1 Tax=Riemerella columbina TaxID=103810 RepID=UPI0012E9AF3C|nr:hypothetical protein [Riemerella columbina]